MAWLREKLAELKMLLLVMANIFLLKLFFNGVVSVYERCQHCQQVKGGDTSMQLGTDEGISGVLGTIAFHRQQFA